MALNIKNKEAERLANEVAALTGSSLTAAVIDALRRHKSWLQRTQRRERCLAEVRAFLEHEVWCTPTLPADQALNEEELLGFGPGGA